MAAVCRAHYREWHRERAGRLRRPPEMMGVARTKNCRKAEEMKFEAQPTGLPNRPDVGLGTRTTEELGV